MRQSNRGNLSEIYICRAIIGQSEVIQKCLSGTGVLLLEGGREGREEGGEGEKEVGRKGGRMERGRRKEVRKGGREKGRGE